MVKTYSLAGLLVVLGFLALERAVRAHTGRSAAVAGVLLALAAGVRLSAGILLPVVWLSLLVSWLKGGGEKGKASVLIGFLIGGGAALLAIYVPFMVAAPEAIKFGLLDYHSGRVIGSLPVLLVYKAGFLIRLVGAYFPLIALEVVAWAIGQRGEERKTADSSRLLPIILTSVAMVTVVHLVAAFPYDDYQVFIMPLLAVAVGIGVSRCQLPSRSSRALSSFRGCSLLFVVCCLLLAHSAASPLLQNWLLAERDRIWWPLRTESSLRTLQRAAKTVRELAAGEGTRIGTRIGTKIGIDEDRDKDRDNDRDKDDSVPSPPVQRLQRETPSTNLSLSRRSSWSKPDPISASSPGVLSRRSFSTKPEVLHEAGFPLPTSHLPPPTVLLTQDTYLAVEAGLRVPAGMELGPFCYFPDMTREKAKACHVLNREMLHEVLASTDASVAAFSGYGLSIRCPEITQLPIDEQAELWRMVESRYEQVAEIEPFGQADTTLRVFGRK
jgi:hypothetical protein